MRKTAVLGVSDFLFVFNLIYGENSLFGKSEASFKPKQDQLCSFHVFGELSLLKVCMFMQ